MIEIDLGAFVALGWFLWDIIHWIYLGVHLLAGPAAGALAWRKGLADDPQSDRLGVRGIATIAWFVLLGPWGLITAALLRVQAGRKPLW